MELGFVLGVVGILGCAFGFVVEAGGVLVVEFGFVIGVVGTLGCVFGFVVEATGVLVVELGFDLDVVGALATELGFFAEEVNFLGVELGFLVEFVTAGIAFGFLTVTDLAVDGALVVTGLVVTTFFVLDVDLTGFG